MTQGPLVLSEVQKDTQIYLFIHSFSKLQQWGYTYKW